MPEHLPPVPPRTTQEAAESALDDALAVRRAVSWELMDRTNDFRDAMAAHDYLAVERTFRLMEQSEWRWTEADMTVMHWRGQVRRYHEHDERQEVAA
jgi:hypothetical protein